MLIGSSEKSSRNYSGGNPVCPRETPKWQKPITNFFINSTKADDDDDAQGMIFFYLYIIIPHIDICIAGYIIPRHM